MPIQRRLPKRGFNNVHRVEYKVFNLGQIDALKEKYGFEAFNPETLYALGLIGRTDRVKILASGELKSKLAFRVSAASAKAKAAIETAGGSVELLVK